MTAVDQAATPRHVLVVDDDADGALTLAALAAAEGLTATAAHSLHDARRELARQAPDVVLLDLRLPDGDGMDLFDDPALPADCDIVLVTGHASVETSIQALRLGAADYLVKPITAAQLQGALARTRKTSLLKAEAAAWQAQWQRTGRFGSLWGRSAAIRAVHEQIVRVAPTAISVFVTGESGTGKELAAQTLHALSRRCEQPFLAVNCGAISPALIESELFGHEKGSFTGAERMRQGFFERAHGGTLFLDEITEMPPDLQVKLLRVLDTGRYLRVGSSQSREADVRIVAATNRPPHEAVASGRLRRDLLYRLNVFPIEMPSLRERGDDILLLAGHFLDAVCGGQRPARSFSAAALAALVAHDWPGNVRELRNAVQRAFVMSEGPVIDATWLPVAAPRLAPPRTGPASEVPSPPGTLPVSIGSTLADVERRVILATLAHFGQQREPTASALGISLKTLYNRLRQYRERSDSEATPE